MGETSVNGTKKSTEVNMADTNPTTWKEKVLKVLTVIRDGINKLMEFLQDAPDADGKARGSMTRLTMLAVIGTLVFNDLYLLIRAVPVQYDIPSGWLTFLLGLYGINKIGGNINIGGKQ